VSFMSPNSLHKKLIAAGIVPERARLLSRGRAVWTEGELSMTLILWKKPGDKLGWRHYTGDGVLGPKLLDFGGLSVSVDPIRPPDLAWPSSGAPLDDEVEQAPLPAQTFVTDRRDLAAILSSEQEIRRGDQTTDLSIGGYPGRLINALIIARDAGASDIEHEVIAKLHSEMTLESDGQRVDVLQDAKYWAKQYEKALGFAIPL